MSDTFSLFVKDFTHLDGAILDPVHGMVGISYKLGIEFIGKTNEEGIVFDFSKAKKCAKKVVDDTADHSLIVGCDNIVVNEEGVAHVKTDSMSYECPTEAVFVVSEVTESQIFAKLEQLIMNACIQNPECSKLKQVRITFSKEEPSENMPFFYHYTHGLRDSCNRCERPGHGHRSTIEVYIDGIRDNNIERKVCKLYHNKHLVFKDNIVPIEQDDDRKYVTITYTSKLNNDYTLKLLKEDVIVYPVETTVENISMITAQWIKKHITPMADIEVVAYEGIEKGCSYLLKNDYVSSLGLVTLFDTKLLKG